MKVSRAEAALTYKYFISCLFWVIYFQEAQELAFGLRGNDLGMPPEQRELQWDSALHSKNASLCLNFQFIPVQKVCKWEF